MSGAVINCCITVGQSGRPTPWNSCCVNKQRSGADGNNEDDDVIDKAWAVCC